MASGLCLAVVAVLLPDLGYAMKASESSEYCGSMEKSPRSIDHQDNPSGWSLVTVQVVARHGDRTPTIEVGDDQAIWNDCVTAREMLPAENATVAFNEAVVRSSKGIGKSFMSNSSCFLGQLTRRGMEQHLHFGEAIRDVYANLSLPGVRKAEVDPRVIKMRSTEIVRSRISSEALVQGVLGSGNAEGHSLQVRTRPLEEENMIPSSWNCPRYGERKKELYHSHSWRARIVMREPLRRRVDAVFKRAPIGTTYDSESMDEHFDVVQTRLCHGKQLPCAKGSGCISTRDGQRVVKEGQWEYRFVYGDGEAARLGIGDFVSELGNELRDASESFRNGSAVPYSLGVFLGHDTTIAPLYRTLFGTGPIEWPPLASSIVLELWHNPSGKFAVSAFYQGKKHTISGCGDPCLLDDFLAGPARPLDTECLPSRSRLSIPPESSLLATMEWLGLFLALIAVTVIIVAERWRT